MIRTKKVTKKTLHNLQTNQLFVFAMYHFFQQSTNKIPVHIKQQIPILIKNANVKHLKTKKCSTWNTFSFAE